MGRGVCPREKYRPIYLRETKARAPTHNDVANSTSHAFEKCARTASPKSFPRNARYPFFLPRVCRAAIFARASTIPELVMTASGQRLSAALFSKSKSSCVIFTLTCTVRFIPPVSGNKENLSNVTKGTKSTSKPLPCVEDVLPAYSMCYNIC